MLCEICKTNEATRYISGYDLNYAMPTGVTEKDRKRITALKINSCGPCRYTWSIADMQKLIKKRLRHESKMQI